MAGGGGWNNYLPFSSKNEDTKWRIPAHADAELFTLLFQQEGNKPPITCHQHLQAYEAKSDQIQTFAACLHACCLCPSLSPAAALASNCICIASSATGQIM